MQQFTAKENDVGQRLSRFVFGVTQNLPHSLLYKSFRNGRIKVNGKKAKPDTRLVQGDKIQLYINDEFFSPRAANSQTSSRSNDKANHGYSGGRRAQRSTKMSQNHFSQGALPPYGTLWKNSEIAFLYKPAGLLCHSDTTGDATLLAAFTATLIANGDYHPAAENTFTPALCNRLDRGTEGLVMAAQSYLALRDMNELIRLGMLRKKYLCVTVGRPPTGIHHAFLQRDKVRKTVTIRSKTKDAFNAGEAKPITTGVQVLEEKNGLCLCEVELFTGRTHQIRAHLAFLGTPILGDRKYGIPAINQKYGVKTQMLCAHKIIFAAELPAENTLQYLAGKSFEAAQPSIIAQWQSCQSKTKY